jgi:glucosamine--fructose-6-phosphate aminotransferase (isomerizing)
MAVKREKRIEPVLPDVAALTGARWFAGKGRRVARLEHVGSLSPEGAEGASIAFLEVVYESADRERYALALREGRECSADDPLWAALARHAGVGAVPGRSRFLVEDLSNTVVSLGDRLVLKLFRRLERGAHPEAELLGALRGFLQVPALEGVVEHGDMTVALVQEYVAGEPVGWEGLITRLAAGEDALEDADALGLTAATLHRQLAAVLPWRRGDRSDLESERAAADAAAAATGERAQLPAVTARLAALDRLVGAQLQRVHGDLHVGQVLQTSRGLVVIDFEGDPSLPLVERSRERSPLVDVASLLLSLDQCRVRGGPARDGARLACVVGGGAGSVPSSVRSPARRRRSRAPQSARGRQGAPRAGLRVTLAPRVAVRPGDRAPDLARGRPVNPDGFLRDILVAPERLAALLDVYEGSSSPLAALGRGAAPRRVVFMGMGSSRFAAVAAATRLRSRGVDAVAELASTGSPMPPAADTLAIGISASGATPETVEALIAHRGTSMTVAVTNEPESELGETADAIVPLLAGKEEGGVACLTYQATVAVLLLLAGRIAGDEPRVLDLRPAVEAAAHIREGRDAWVDVVVDLVDSARMIATIAPAERFSSALQSALMLREGPRVAADAAETGDWLHVDVYLSKRPGYAALLFTGSRFERGVLEWATKRSFPVVAVGGSLPGATPVISYPGANDPNVTLLVETGVAELVAAVLWQRRIAAGDSVLVDPWIA